MFFYLPLTVLVEMRTDLYGPAPTSLTNATSNWYSVSGDSKLAVYILLLIFTFSVAITVLDPGSLW